MDSGYPPIGVAEAYELVVDELEVRAQQAVARGPVRQLRETFRDNPLYGRFELLIDGSLAMYIKYTMTGGQVVLTDGVEQPGFRDEGIDAVLMRRIVLNVHKRRLSLIPQCPVAFSFFADYPPRTRPSQHDQHTHNLNRSHSKTHRKTSVSSAKLTDPDQCRHQLTNRKRGFKRHVRK